LALAGILDQTDPPLIKRGQRYEREALEELFDRNIGRVYALCFALTGSGDEAETLTARAFRRSLDTLPSFNGDARAYDGWVLRLAATSAGRAHTDTGGLRGAYQRLAGHEQEVVALRLLAGFDADRVARITRRSAADVRTIVTESLRKLRGRRLQSGGNLQAFDTALDKVAAGADPDAEGATLLVPPDATYLLRQAAELISLPKEPLGPSAAARLRTAFVADAAERRAVWVQRNQKAAMVPGVVLRRGSSRISAGVVVLLIGLVAIMAGGSLAVFSMFASPGSPPYPIKRFAENVLLTVNRDPTSRADFELKLASTRSREAEDMAVNGNGDLAVAAMSDRFDSLRAAGYDLARAPRRDARWTDARNRFSSQASQSTEEIQQDLVATHQKGAQQEVKALTEQFQRDRKNIDGKLGKSPGPSPSPTPPG
jgi:DNA-directed RNA polymerase specialized sigma24 family protein